MRRSQIALCHFLPAAVLPAQTVKVRGDGASDRLSVNGSGNYLAYPDTLQDKLTGERHNAPRRVEQALEKVRTAAASDRERGNVAGQKPVHTKSKNICSFSP